MRAAIQAPAATVPPQFSSLGPETIAAGLRFNTYPAVDRFVEAFGAPQATQALAQRNGAAAPVSVYVHIPFCGSQCHHCDRHHRVTRQRSQGTHYLDLLAQEIDLASTAVGRSTRVANIEVGGGTPTFLDDDGLARLLALLRSALRVDPAADVSLEVDPRTVDGARLATLHGVGFNRIRLSMADLEPGVQQAVNRHCSFERLEALVHAAQALPMRSTTVELSCGLPRQNAGSFSRTVSQVAALRPTSIDIGCFDHRPLQHAPQCRIDAALLPDADARLAMLDAAMAVLLASGYETIGLHQWALPGDALAVAKRLGCLTMGPGGFTVHDGDLLGFGVSAVSCVGASYSQNAITLDDYRGRLAQHRLPVVRGLALSRDDLLRRSVMMALLCQGRVDFQALANAHLLDPRVVLCAELTRIAQLAACGLVRLSEAAIELTPAGCRAAPMVAAVFDGYRSADARRHRYPRLI